MIKNPRIIFFGNSKYSVIDAEALRKHFGLSAIVTLPDSINRQTKKPVQGPVNAFARAHHIPLVEAEKLTPDIIEKIKSFSPDFLVVADYGLILPKSLLSVPLYAPLNIHHSLLPKYRGPAPAPAAILNGDKVSGVSVILMTPGVDEGDILAQIPYELKPDETTDSLLTELNKLGAQAVVEVIEKYLEGTAQPKKQNEKQATVTKYMSRNDGLIDLSGNPEINWRKIRAFGTWPGTFFVVKHRGKKTRVKIKKAAFQDGVLTVQRVVPENKKEMSYEDFLRGLS